MRMLFRHDTAIDEACGIAVGAASGCWVEQDGQRVFDSDEASDIVDQLVRHISWRLSQPDEQLPELEEDTMIGGFVGEPLPDLPESAYPPGAVALEPCPSPSEMDVEDEDQEPPHPLAADLTMLLNRVSAENDSNTPDFMLANYLIGCLEIFGVTVRARDEWYGIQTGVVKSIGEPDARPEASNPAEHRLPEAGTPGRSEADHSTEAEGGA